MVHERMDAKHEQAFDKMKDKMQKGSAVTVHKESFGGVKRLSEADQLKVQNAWLRDIRVSLDIKEPISANELVRMLKKQGINITTATDLDHHAYSGFGVKDVDGETALNLLFGSMGLDYNVNSAGKYVTITPLASKTYYLNLGNRQTSFGSGSDGASSSSPSTGSSGQSGGSSSGGMGSSPSTGSSGQSGGSSSSGGMGSSQASGGGGSQANTITASDFFWRSLSIEIEQRLKVLTPNRSAMLSNLAMPPIMPNLSEMPIDLGGMSLPLSGNVATSIAQQSSPPASTGGSAGNYYIEQKMGNFSINPETGAVTIRAPRWLLDSFTDYFQRISDQYNTVVQFDCEIIQLTTSSETREGLDVASFASFAHGQYNAVVTNNALGGVNVSIPTATTALATAAGNAFPAAVPMVGMVSAANKLQIFNAYLSSLGHIDIIQRPIIATSSGIPGEFKKMQRQFYNSIQQTAASGGVGGAATATQNQQIPFDTGNWLRIFPHYDPTNGLVRAQISLQQAIQTSSQTQNQFITVGNTIQQVATQIPIISSQQYSGETLLRDGDLVVVGGQVDEDTNMNHSGITGLMDINYLQGIFGVKNISKKSTTYYFALHVHIKNRKT